MVNQIQRVHKDKAGIRINLGCGVHLLFDFINIDNAFTYAQLKSKKGIFKNAKIEKNAVYLLADAKYLPLDDNVAEYIMVMDMVEHIRMRDVETVFSEMYRVLMPGGKLVIFTTEFRSLLKEWLESNKVFDPQNYIDTSMIIYGNQQGYGDGELHKCPFTPAFMNYVMQRAGFTEYTIVIHPMGSPHPEVEGYGKVEGVLASTMMLVEATKVLS